MPDIPSFCLHCGAALGQDRVCVRCLLDPDRGLPGLTKAERLFQSALAYADGEERAGFVRTAAAGDSALLEEVECLLAGFSEAGDDGANFTLIDAPGPGARSEETTPTPRDEVPGAMIDHFRLEKLIGEGGMGEVWEARQTAPMRRPVAIKIIKRGLDTDEVIRRFERERRTLALMTHPHIAQVFEAGATPQGRLYFAMELVTGEPLTTYCQSRGLEVRERLALFLEVCSAIEHAHQKGVIHRDLKPSNILVADGAVKVIDFGVAKVTQDSATDALVTRHTQVLGTPAYMSPEQAESEGRDVDTRTDVYSLGVVLYELLSGALPFDPQRFASTGLREIQRILREEVPPLPSTRLAKAAAGSAPQPRGLELRGDLDWIVLKAMAKERDRRYASAASLAQDVRCFLDGGVVSAVPPTLAYRCGKFIRRHHTAVAAVTAVVLALAAGLIVSLHQVRQTRAALAGQIHARQEATLAVADLHTRFGLAAGEKGEPSRAALWFTSAALIAETDPDRAEANRRRAATWTAEAAVPVRAFATGWTYLDHIAWHPEGRALIAIQVDGSGAQVWDLAAETESPLTRGGPVTGAAWDASGSLLALSQEGKVTVRAWPSGEPLAELSDRPASGQVAFDPAGQRLAIASSPPLVWEWRSGRTLTAEAIPNPMKRVRWSPDGRAILWQSTYHVGVCQADRPEKLSFPAIPNHHRCLADFAGGAGRFFHSSADGRESFLRDSLTGEVIAETRGSGYPVARSRDDRFLARSSGPLWRMDGAEGPDFPRPSGNSLMLSADFSADGSRLATASYDAAVRLWSVAENRLLGLIGWHQNPVQHVSFDPSGTLAATTQDGLVRIWRLPPTTPRRTIPVGTGSLAALSPDGRHVAAAGLTNLHSAVRRVRVFATDTGQPAGPEIDPGGVVMETVFLPESPWLAVACSTTPDRAATDWKTGAGSGHLQLWNWQTGEPAQPPVALPSEPRGLAVHPSGDFIGIYGAGGEGLEWERPTGHLRTLWPPQLPSFPQHTLNNGRCAYTDDGRFLVAWGQLDELHAWDRQTGRPVPVPAPQGQSIVHDVSLHGSLAAFSPMGPAEPRVTFFDLAQARLLPPALPHSNWLYLGRFDAAGDRFLTTGRGALAQVWDWRRQERLGPVLPHVTDTMAGLFVPGTPWVITGSHDGWVRFWDYRNGLPLRPPLACPGLILQVQLTPDARQLLIAGWLEGGGPQIIDMEHLLPPLPRAPDPATERLLAEINASATIHDGGGLVPLTAQAWLEKWQRFRQAHPDASTFPPAK